MINSGYFCIAALCFLLGGCWANPSLVKIQSDPPGARVFYNGQDLGATPISKVLTCMLQTQYVRLELADYPTQNIPLYKKPINYYVPWYAIVAAGLFTFRTTWRSEACVPDDLTVTMANGAIQRPAPSSPAEAEARAAQDEWIKKNKQDE